MPRNRRMTSAVTACRIFKHDARTSRFDASSDVASQTEFHNNRSTTIEWSSTAESIKPRSYMRICYRSWPGSIGVNILTARIFRNIIGFASPSPRTCWETRWLCFATCLLLSENNDAIHDLQESVWCSSIYVICTSCWVFDDTARISGGEDKLWFLVIHWIPMTFYFIQFIPTRECFCIYRT